jgi:hypothetical protein
MSRKGLVAMLTFVAALGSAPPAHAIIRELGQEEPFPAASCPDNCQAIGRVSGFQVRQGERQNPVVVPRDGKIVAFTVRLGAPNPEQTQFFNGLFGSPAQVRLSILRKEVRRVGRRRRRVTEYRLTGQGPVIDVSRYFGSKPSFVLPRPMSVRRGYIIALTVPTWVPAFAVGLGEDQAWRSSRASDACDDVSRPAAQQTRGSLRAYRCLYRTARLLYSATWVRNPEPTNQPADGGRSGR